MSVVTRFDITSHHTHPDECTTYSLSLKSYHFSYGFESWVGTVCSCSATKLCLLFFSKKTAGLLSYTLLLPTNITSKTIPDPCPSLEFQCSMSASSLMSASKRRVVRQIFHGFPSLWNRIKLRSRSNESLWITLTWFSVFLSLNILQFLTMLYLRTLSLEDLVYNLYNTSMLND
jgi:hypothetical protein